MSVVGNKIRVYDLAREVKQDTKRIIEDLRREGADVDVPSNSVSKELAEKIRNKYIPKVDAAPKRAIKVIKKRHDSEEHEEVHAPEIVAEEPPAATVDFSRDVRPLLSQHCFACHGPDAEVRQGGLRW